MAGPAPVRVDRPCGLRAFLVTRNGLPVGELTPVRHRQFVAARTALAVFAGSPVVDPERFRSDVDAALDQDMTPRV